MLSQNLLDIFKSIPNAKVAEIGVAKGETAAKILSCENVDFYFGIDPYELYKDTPSDKYKNGYLDLKMVVVPKNEGEMSVLKKICLKNLEPFEGRYKLIQKFSHIAVEEIEDSSLDIVYIDGNHQYEYVLDDLELWTPKAKTGGYIIGDDYDFSGGPVTENYGGKIACEVDRACQDFCKQHNLSFTVLDGNFIIKKP